MNEMILAWVRPIALMVVIFGSVYMEVMQLKVSEFWIGLTTAIVVWFFKDRGEEKAKEQAIEQIKASKQ